MTKIFILASASKWRKRLLARHGIRCKVYVSNFTEKRRHKDPKLLVLHNACGKVRKVASHYKNALVVGVDTVGIYRKQRPQQYILKPKNRNDAKRMLQFLSGKTHRVITGLCMIDTVKKKKYKIQMSKKCHPEFVRRSGRTPTDNV